MNSLVVGDLTSFYSVSEEDHKTNTNGFHSDMLPVKYISHFEVFPPRVSFWHDTVSRDDLIKLGAHLLMSPI